MAKGNGSFIIVFAVAVCLAIWGAQARIISTMATSDDGESAHARSKAYDFPPLVNPRRDLAAGNAPPPPTGSSVLPPPSNPPRDRGCLKIYRCRQDPPRIN
ncbi:hypothetical protein NL676_000622 [Syzygium grande]|nr:hypothetical protein NL676_000622 [Syzygium grande]